MNLLEAKIYYDGSHWIAIPHTERPYRKKRRRQEREKSEELQQFEERFEKAVKPNRCRSLRPCSMTRMRRNSLCKNILTV